MQQKVRKSSTRHLGEFGLTHEMFTDKRFTRLKWLRHLLDTNKLDKKLRWN